MLYIQMVEESEERLTEEEVENVLQHVATVQEVEQNAEQET